MASVTEEARRQANLKLLQRTCDASIQAMLQSATHVVLYEFKDNNWAKCGVEGSCFLVASTKCVVQMIILNRNSANNFALTVQTHLQVQDQDPFLILQESTAKPPRTLGIWFHSADERVAMATQLQMAIQQLASQTFVFPVVAVAAATAAPPRAPLPAAHEVTQDERDHLAALLSNTALAAAAAAADDGGGGGGGARSHSAPKAATTAGGSNNNNNASPSQQMPGGSVALDKKALQLTLLSLIQDERFLDLLHSQYLRVVHARAKKNNQS